MNKVKNNSSIHSTILKFPHPVLKANKLKKGRIKSFQLLGKPYVLYRDKAGKPVAVPGGCPHRGALLSKGKVNAAGELVCAYHAWRIKSDGTAICPSVPKRSCKIAVLKTWEKCGFIWVANADVEEAAFPEFIRPDFELIGQFTSLFKAPLKVVLDNFGEIEHAFQVHSFIGPNKNKLDSVDFKVAIKEDSTYGFMSCKYRTLPFFSHKFFGIKSGDYYHNDWVFKFNPLHGSYHNYWTDKTGKEKRPVSFIINSFLVPVNDKEVNVHVFVQMAVKSKWLNLIKPLLKLSTLAITLLEIKADADIASFAPENAEDTNWKLTHLDKQLMPNRKLMERIYFGKEKEEHPTALDHSLVVNVN